MPTAKLERVGVTGHQDMPAEARALLVEKLTQWFPEPDKVDVVCSLAIGADSIVAEYLTSRGAELHVVIPCNGYEDTFQNAEDLAQYRTLLSRAAFAENLGFDRPTEEAFMAAGALVTRSSDWLIAVWDGQDARGRGGTGDVVALARSLRKPVRIVWPNGVQR